MSSKTAAPAKSKNSGPNRPQIRILQAMAKARKPLTKAALAKASGVHVNWIAEYVGSKDGEPRVRQSGELKDLKLVPAGLAKLVSVDVDGQSETMYDITAPGRKALEKAAAK